MRLRSRRALNAALAGLMAFPAVADPEGARFIGSFQWQMDDPAFGGFSAIELSEDGTTFTVLSDRAVVTSGRITRHEGRITGVTAGPLTRLRNPEGRRMAGHVGDSEGLAIGPSGPMFVSFEGVDRVWAYEDPARALPLPRLAEWDGLEPNGGLEALAIDADGALYTLPERSGQANQPFPLWRFRDGAWQQVAEIPRRGGFLPVGADFDAEDRFYLLEREFTGIGFRSRVRRFGLDEAGITGEEVLLESALLEHDNLEGIAVWSPAPGHIRLTMISDDNFFPLQSTQIVEYDLTESLAEAAARP